MNNHLLQQVLTLTVPLEIQGDHTCPGNPISKHDISKHDLSWCLFPTILLISMDYIGIHDRLEYSISRSNLQFLGHPEGIVKGCLHALNIQWDDLSPKLNLIHRIHSIGPPSRSLLSPDQNLLHRITS